MEAIAQAQFYCRCQQTDKLLVKLARNVKYILIAIRYYLFTIIPIQSHYFIRLIPLLCRNNLLFRSTYVISIDLWKHCIKLYFLSHVCRQCIEFHQSGAIYLIGSYCSCNTLASSLRAGLKHPLNAFFEALAFPSSVLGPVDCSHGFHVLISSACRCRRSGVQLFIMLFL